MPRAPRLDYPGALHHVIARGIERRKIFRSGHDRRDFLYRLGNLVADSGASLYAWALMPNHFHLLLRTGQRPLSTAMQSWLGGYASSFNRLHRRSGHLFGNRFKNILVEEETHLLELVRYIHLNPVRSRLPVTLDSLDRYPWTGHAVLLGLRPFPAQDTGFILGHFGRRTGPARHTYRMFVREGIGVGQTDLDGGGLCRSAGGWEHVRKLCRGRERWAFDERVLGSDDFVLAVLEHCQIDERQPATANNPADLLRNLCTDAAARFHVAASEIASSSLRRNVLQARAMVCYLAVRHHGLTLSAVARYLSVSVNSVARAIDRGEHLFSDDSVRERVLAY